MPYIDLIMTLPAAKAPSPGSGPRHLAFHPNLPLLYLVDELSSQLTAYRLDTLTRVQVMSTLPRDFVG